MLVYAEYNETTCSYFPNVLCVFYCFQLVLTMGNYMNKGNMRIGAAAGFKIEYLNKVRLSLAHCIIEAL